MLTVELDQEVYWRLGRFAATASVRTPNDAIRALLDEVLPDESQPWDHARILFSSSPGSAPDKSETQPRAARSHEANDTDATDALIKRILQAEFGGNFRTVSPFRMMFEGQDALVYFQNFNKSGAPNLWYRLNPSALNRLRNSHKQAFVCLTNPSEAMVLLLPFADIDARAKAKHWSRAELEVNIDIADLRWRELDWPLLPYRRLIAASGEAA